MKKKANILSIQFRPKLGDKKKNLEKVKSLITPYCGKEIDLIVLPEFFTTGINQKAMEENIEPADGGESIKFLSELAKQCKSYIVCGTVFEKEEGKVHNTSFVLDRNGQVTAKYRKIHLFNFMGGTEGERITPGDETVVVDTDFAKLGLSICFDIRYPLHFRKLVKQGAEIFVSPTAWGYLNSMEENEKKEFIELWCSLNRVRAAENLAYMVSADMCGKVDNFLSAAGNSIIAGPMGNVLQNAGNEEAAVFARVDLEELRVIRSSYPIAEID